LDGGSTSMSIGCWGGGVRGFFTVGLSWLEAATPPVVFLNLLERRGGSMVKWNGEW
jgi:hypothetical protein